MTDTPPADPVSTAVQTTQDLLTSAIYSIHNGAVPVETCITVAQTALAQTDYANVLAGYSSAATVANAAATGITPTADQIEAYSAGVASQGGLVRSILP